MFDRKAFFAALRRRGSGVFGTRLSQKQVEGVDAILDEGISRRTPLKHMAYILATAYHETGGRMQPIRENLNYSVSGLLETFGRHRISAADARKYGRSGSRKANQEAIANIIYGGEWGRENLGNTEPGDGWRFRGGGLPQNTGRRNYTLLGLADRPDLVTDLKTSVRMMFDAMEQGIYTGKRLDDYTDFLSMRRIINGTDKAEKIAAEAEAFQAALRASNWGLYPVQTPLQAPETKRIPKEVEEVVEDAAADNRVSMTEVGAACSGIAGTATAVNEAAEAAKETGVTLLGMGPWVLVALLAAGFAGYVILERRRKKKQARAAKAVM
jgi:putative chitinase